jgi:hypothetical protein
MTHADIHGLFYRILALPLHIFASGCSHFNPLIHVRSSSSETLPLNLSPFSQFPLPASSARCLPLLPMPLLEDVQNGITVASPKS